MVRKNGNTDKLNQFRRNGGTQTLLKRTFYNTANPSGLYDPMDFYTGDDIEESVYDATWKSTVGDSPNIEDSTKNTNSIDLSKGSLSSTPSNAERSTNEKPIARWIKDTYNKFNEVLYENLVNSDFGQLERNIDDLNAILFLKKYSDLVKQKRRLQDLLDTCIRSNDKNRALSLQYQINDIDNSLRQYDDWVMTVGKNNPVIANQMFDIDKIEDYDRRGNVIGAGAALKYGVPLNIDAIINNFKNADWTGKGSGGAFSWEAWKNSAELASENVEKGIAAGVGLILRPLHYTADMLGFGKLFGAENRYDDLKLEYIQHGGYLASRDENYKKIYEENLRKMYKGYSSHDKSKGNYHLYGEFTDDSKIDKWLNNSKEEQKEIETSLLDHILALRSGRVKWFGRSYQQFDPKDVSREYQSRYNKNEKEGIDYISSDWLYTLPEVASTISLFDNQAYGMLATNAFALLMGGVRKVAGNIISDVVKKIAVNVFSAGTGIAVANRSRLKETGMESITAQQQRLLDNLIKLSKDGNFDYDQTLNDIKDRLKSFYKIDPTGMDELQLLLAAISYRMDDIVPGLAELRPGIQRLINENNALAVTEYLLTLPFMHFEGSALKNTVKNRLKESASDAWDLTKKGWRKIPGSTKIAGVASKLNPVNTERYQAIATRISNFNKSVANKFVKDDMPFVRTKMGRIGQYLGRKALDYGKIAAYESVLEGGEEGVQQILTNDYVSGKYDKDPYAPTSYLDLYSFSNIPNLYANAFLDYLGLNTGDPYNADKEIRNAMNIGFISSLMFSGALKSMSNKASNLYNDPYSNNLRNLVQQMKADAFVNQLVADYGKAAQDADHINLFTERFLRNEKSIVPILRSLNDMKRSAKEDGLITETDIEADKKLAINTYTVLNNEYLQKKMDEDGIKKGSDQYKLIIIDGATALTDYQMTRELVEGQHEQLLNINKEIADNVRVFLSDETSDSERNEMIDKNPGFYAVIEDLRLKHSNLELVHSTRFNYINEAIGNIKHTNDELYITDVSSFVRENLNNLSKTFGFEKEYLRKLADGNYDKKDTIKKVKECKDFILKVKDVKLDDHLISEYEFITNYINNLLNLLSVKQMQKTSELLTNHNNLLEMIRKETGLDVDTEKLRGIVDVCREMADERFEPFRQIELAHHGANIYSMFESELTNISEDKFGENSTFGEEFNKLITSLFINSAALYNQASIAKMYTGTSISSYEIKNAIWGKDALGTVIDNEAKDIEEAFLKLFKPVSQQSDITDIDRKNILDSIAKTSGEGNWKAIKKLAEERGRRKRIARREWKEEALSESEEASQNEEQTPSENNTRDATNNNGRIEEGVGSRRLGKEITGGSVVKSDELVEREVEQKAKEKAEQKAKEKDEGTKEGKKPTTKSPVQDHEPEPASSHKESTPEGKAKPAPEEGITLNPDQLGLDGKLAEGLLDDETPTIVITETPDSSVSEKEINELYKSYDDLMLRVSKLNLEIIGVAQDDTENLGIRRKLNNLIIVPGKDLFLDASDARQAMINRSVDSSDYAQCAKALLNAIDKVNVIQSEVEEIKKSIKAEKNKSFSRLEDVPTDKKSHRLSDDDRVLKLEEIPGIEYEWWAKPWRDQSEFDKTKDKKDYHINETVRVYIKGKKDHGYYEIVVNIDPSTGKLTKEVSVHFKPEGKTLEEMKLQFTNEEKELLFTALHENIPTGWTVTTYGELTKGGIHGLDRFGDQFGYEKVGEHSGKMKGADEEVKIPIYRKPNDSVDIGTDPVDSNDSDIATDEDVFRNTDETDETEDALTQLDKELLEKLKADEDLLQQLDLSELKYDEDSDRFITKDGKVLDEETSKKIEDELTLLGLIDVAVVSQEELPDGTKKTVVQKRILADDLTVRDLVSSTMFYQPDATDPMVLKVGDEVVTFDKPIRPGQELAQRLTENGFLENAKKYFVVTESNRAATAENRYDAATVVMCIETDDAVYLTALRNLGTTKTEYKKGRNTNEDDLYLKYWKLSNVDEQGFVTVNNEDNLTLWLEMCNISNEKCAQVYEELYGNVPQMDTDVQIRTVYRKALMGVAKKIAFNYYKAIHPSASQEVQESEAYYKEFERWWYEGPRKGSKEEGLEDANYKLTVLTCVDRARILLLKPGKEGLTAKQIQQQVNALREYRNKIISTYAQLAGVDMENPASTFPTTPIKSVVPTSVTASNGKIDNVRDENGIPQYRGVLETSEKTPTIDDYMSALNDDKLIFGYGTGVFSNSPYAIVQLNGEQVLFNGRGLSGKIFMMAKNDRTGMSIPIMLAEEKFNSQKSNNGSVYYNRDIRLALELGADGKATLIDNGRKLSDQEVVDRQPSAAEVLLYMICGKISSGTQSNEDILQITEFFIHNGEKTLLRTLKKLLKNPISAMMSKQLNFDANRGVLEIAVPTGEVTNSGTVLYKTAEYKVDDIFADTEESKQLRLILVQRIAELMHWNTDKDYLTSSFSVMKQDSVISKFLNYLLVQKQQNGDFVGLTDEQVANQRISIMGCDQLSFRIGDFFESNNGKMTLRSDGVSVMAWMLSEKKLKTDVSEKLFKDPFVFAEGVGVSNEPITPKPKKGPVEKEGTKTVTKKYKADEEKPFNFVRMAVTSEGFHELTDRLFPDQRGSKDIDSEFARKVGDVRTEPDGWGEHNGIIFYKITIPGRAGDNVTYFFNVKSLDDIPENIRRVLNEELLAMFNKEVSNTTHVDYGNLDYSERDHADFLKLLTMIANGDFSSNKEESLKESGVYPFFNQKSYDVLVGRKNDWKNALNPSQQVATSKLERDKLADLYKEEDKIGINDVKYNVVDRFIATPQSGMTNELFYEDFCKKYKDVTGIDLSNLPEERRKFCGKMAVKTSISMIEIGKNEKGEYGFKLTPYATNNFNKLFSTYLAKQNRMHVSGVYSNKQSKKPFNEKKARHELHRLLGIDDANVIVTDAILMSMQDEEIFGLTDVCMDALAGGLTGYITLSERGGLGVAYHEAWHYVNLLMHDSSVRNAIYRDYLKTHKELNKKGVKVKDVEEALAEEFRIWMENSTDNSIKGRMKLMFQNIKYFLNTVLLHRHKYRATFRAIQKGKYKNLKVDKQSVAEFKRQYPKGAFLNYRLPGLSTKDTLSIDVDTYGQYYDAARSITNNFILTFDIKSTDDITRFSQNSAHSDIFKQVVDSVQEMIDNLDEDADAVQIHILKTLLRNPKQLKKLFVESLIELGIKPKIVDSVKKKDPKKNDNLGVSNSDSQEDALDDALEKEDTPDNYWDQVDLTVSKKQNAAGETKLFMRAIPKLKRDFDSDTGFVEEFDDYGVQKLYMFDEAWNKMSNELALCQSFADRNDDGTYKSTSIMGTVERNATSDVFWYSVNEKLKELAEDPFSTHTTLKSQLFTTFCSSKNPVHFIELKDSYIKKTNNSNEDFFNVSDDVEQKQRVVFETDVQQQSRERMWSEMGDEAFIITRSVPRRWSSILASNGLAVYNPDTQQTELNEEYVKKIAAKWKELTSLVSASKITEDQAYDKLFGNNGINVVEKLTEFFNLVGIAADRQLTDAFILAMSRDVKDTPDSATKRYKGIQKMVQRDGAGNFNAIVKNLQSSVGKPYLDKIGRSKTQKQFDEVFNNCPQNSLVATLAIIFNNYHPNLQDYSVKGPNGETYYPIGQNNSLSSAIRQLNSNENGEIQSLELSSYTGQNSIILNAAKKADANNPSSGLKINTFVGMKDANAQKGSDFLEIGPIDDYLAKMFMTENDAIIFPTMADKKTWYSLTSPNIKLCHDIILRETPYEISFSVKKEAFKLVLDKYNKKYNTKVEVYRNRILKLYDSIDTIEFLESVKLELDLNDNEAKKLKTAYEIIESLAQEFGINTEEQLDAFRSDLIRWRDDVKVIQNDRLKELGFSTNRLSDNTLILFSNYFINELNALIDYYSRENVASIVKNPNKAKENFHGKIKDGRMLFGGNGGLFRYFYDIEQTRCRKGDEINLNLKLEALWITQQQIEKDGLENKASSSKVYKNVSVTDIAEQDGNGNLLDLDGFELIRAELNRLKDTYTNTLLNNSMPNQTLMDSMNHVLMSLIYDEMSNVCDQNSQLCLGQVNEYGMPIPHSLPREFMQKWRSRFIEAKLNCDFPYGSMEDVDSQNIFISCVGNYLLNSMISIIEIEKIFTGDPALYKYKTNKNDPAKKISFTQKIKAGNSQVAVDVKTEVSNMYDMFSDKIKRLGGTESPGLEVRVDFTEEEKQLLGNDIASTKYTVLNVEDVEIPSAFYELTSVIFEKQLFVDSIRRYLKSANKKPKWFENAINKYVQSLDATKDEKELRILQNQNISEQQIDYIYDNDEFFEILKNEFYNRKGEEAEKEIDVLRSSLDKQMKPYEKINVCDAQVFIRPAMYRRIKLGLGEWSTEEDSTGYSDEKAYQLIENGILDGEQVDPSSWMSDPELYKLIKKFQTNILKMSYFKNETDTTGEQNTPYNNAVYNKMALMPLFKFHTSTEVGKSLYERMNRSGHEIDMIAFKSAVKVGGKKNTIVPVENPKLKRDDSGHITNNDDIKSALGRLTNSIKNNSDLHVDYNSDTVIQTANQENTLPISIQNIKDLRLQLNTHAHEKTERSIGSLMFKLAFSNIIEDATYGHSTGNIRTGRQLKLDIMDTLFHLSRKGVITLRDRFYTEKEVEYDVEVTDENGNKTKEKRTRKERFVDKDKVADFIQDIAESQGLGVVAEDILNRGGVVESLASRAVFEQSLCKLIEREVVEIRTNGGTAVQLSSFGFAGEPIVGTQEFGQYHSYNNGEELKWVTEDNSMEVLLSMNFFKPVVPKEYLTDYTTMREWLIEHDVIKGTKKDGSQSNPKPFGIGYRIPTQGMSSMFSFVVADVLPEIAGDTIIVPREFTAQTGSDFDIDKLYLATFEYENGEICSILYKETKVTDKDGKESVQRRVDTAKSSKGAFGNRLLQDYIDLITDRRNFANARASIDVITSIIQDDVLPYVRSSKEGYLKGGSQLSPSFQTNRKSEFSVGKTGIGPFALNVTNMALTLFTHLSFEYGENEYGFGHLDLIYGTDGLRIADWLSAMVNAHVDVAKDAYVFDLNINNETYNHVSFWLRAGMGASTFFVLANPAVKKYIQRLQSASGMYKTHTQENEKTFGKKDVAELKKLYKNVLSQINDTLREILSSEGTTEFLDNKKYNVTAEILSNVMSYYGFLAADTKEQKKLKKVKDRVESKKVVFNTDVTRARNACANYYSTNPRERLDALVFSLYCLEAYKDSNQYAEALGDLVQSSKIDTKKFGNTVDAHINFENNMNMCKNTNQLFTLNIPESQKKELFDKLPARYDKEGKPLPVQQEDISKLALYTYFNNTFLQEMFGKTLKYMRMLLWNQSYKASNVYKNLFISVAANVFGEQITQALVFDEKTNKFVDKTVHGYDKIFSDDTVKAFGDGIENIMRYLSLMSFGADVYESLKRKNPDALDFTENNSVSAVRNRMQQLIFGEYTINKNGESVQTKKSIFTRLSELQTELRMHPERYDSSLVDEDGNIVNEMLIFLTPLMPSEKYPIGRIICSQPTTFVKGERKSRLTAAFSELLYNENEEIRTLARDLAFYSYHSSYDQGGGNSFFEFVTPDIRMLYDKSLRNSMDLLGNTDKKSTIKLLQLLETEKLPDDADLLMHMSRAAQSIIDILCRNYWYDNTFIKPHKPSTKESNDYLQGSEYTPSPKKYKDFGTGKVGKFPKYIMSSRQSNRLYLKLQSNGVTVLYRKVGQVRQTRVDERGKLIKGSTMAVFVPVQKSGIHLQKAKLFEFSTGYDVPSIYAANHMYETFAEDVVRREVEEYVQKSNEYVQHKVSSHKNKNKEFWDIELEWTTEQPKAFVADNFDVYEKTDEFYNEPKKGFHIGREYLTSQNAKDKTVFLVAKKSTVVIDVSNGDSEFGWNISKHRQDETEELKDAVYGEDHAVLFDIQKGISEQLLSKIDEIIANRKSDDISLMLTTRYYDYQILKLMKETLQENGKSYYQNALDETINVLRDNVSKLSTIEEAEKIAQKTKDSLEKPVKEMSRREKNMYYEFINRITSEYINSKIQPLIETIEDAYNISSVNIAAVNSQLSLSRVGALLYKDVLAKKSVSVNTTFGLQSYYNVVGSVAAAKSQMDSAISLMKSIVKGVKFGTPDEQLLNEEEKVDINTDKAVDESQKKLEDKAESQVAKTEKEVEEAKKGSKQQDEGISLSIDQMINGGTAKQTVVKNNDEEFTLDISKLAGEIKDDGNSENNKC